MIVNTIEKFRKFVDKYGGEFPEERIEELDNWFKQGAFLFTYDEATKKEWTLASKIEELLHSKETREEALPATSAEDEKELKRRLLGKEDPPILISSAAIRFDTPIPFPKVTTVYHWSKDKPYSPFDFLIHFDDGMIWAVDVKSVSGDPPRVNIQPKYGKMPNIPKKVDYARQRKWIPFYAFQDLDESFFYLYPMSKNGYLTKLHSNPYFHKMARKSHKWKDDKDERSIIARNLEDYQAWIARYGKPEKKPIILNV